MSAAVTKRVWQGSALRGDELLLLLAVADAANDDGVAEISIVELANRLRITQEAVRYYLGGIVGRGEAMRMAGAPGGDEYTIRITIEGRGEP